MKEVWTTPDGVEETVYTYTYLGVRDGVDIAQRDDGTGPIEVPMAAGFLNNFKPDEGDLEGFTVTGSETLDTPFGRIACEIYEMAGEDGTEMKVWFCSGNGIAFRVDMSTTNERGYYHIERTIIESNLFVGSEGSDTPDTQPSGELRTDLAPGDRISYILTGTSNGEDMGVNTMTIEVESVGWRFAEVTLSNTGQQEGSRTYFETLDDLRLFTSPANMLFGMFGMGDPDDYEAVLGMLTSQGTETIPTVFGDVECERLSLTESGVTMTVWIGEGDISYRAMFEGSAESVVIDQGETTLYGPAPEHEPVDISGWDILADLRPGDSVVTGLNGVVTTTTVTAVDGDTVTCTWSRSDESPGTEHTQEMSVDEFFNELVVDTSLLDTVEPIRTETIRTNMGDVTCNVYSDTVDGNTETIWLDPLTGVVYRAQSSAGGMYELLDTSLLTETVIVQPSSA